jgi:hypothetical protein
MTEEDRRRVRADLLRPLTDEEAEGIPLVTRAEIDRALVDARRATTMPGARIDGLFGRRYL